LRTRFLAKDFEITAIVARQNRIAVYCNQIDQKSAEIMRVRTERCLSGRKERFAKPSYGQKLYREFESLPLRQILQEFAIATIPRLMTQNS
jgi:hypothetical protein